MSERLKEDKHYVFYDGDCGFCNFWVQWILKRDLKDQFLFAALQSDFGQKFLKERNLEYLDFATLFLWKPNAYYYVKSEAVFKILKILGGKYALWAKVDFLPRSLSDEFYHIISKYRKTLNFKICELPTKIETKKIIR